MRYTQWKQQKISILLPLIVNTDGANVFKSNRKSMWLTQVCQGYLRTSKRYLTQNMSVVGAHFESRKPRMSDFFYPFLNDIKNINNRGGITLMRNGREYSFCLFVICSCDLPAKADLQGFVGHSGKFGCGYCIRMKH